MSQNCFKEPSLSIPTFVSHICRGSLIRIPRGYIGRKWSAGDSVTVDALDFLPSLDYECSDCVFQYAVGANSMAPQLLLLFASILWVDENIVSGANIRVRRANSLIEVALVACLSCIKALACRYKRLFKSLDKVMSLVCRSFRLHRC